MTRSGHVAAGVAVFSVVGLFAAQAAQDPRPKLVSPVKGPAKVEITRPNTKVVGKEVVTTILLKNIEAKPIAGLKVDENWYDAGGTPVGGNTYRHPRPLQPGEVIKVELRSARTPQLNRNQCSFSHVNGPINQKVVPKLELPKPEATKPRT
jgi:acyl dehydratase